MTDQPPPGNYPPPPPPPGGYPPPPPPPGGGYTPPPPPPAAGGEYGAPPQAATAYPPAAAAAPALPTEAYTAWGTRVLAWLIDAIPLLILEGIGWGLLLGTGETECNTQMSEYDVVQNCSTGTTMLGTVAIAVTGILALIYWIWNLGYRQGTTGSSIGKSIMKFKIINEKTGQPVGFGMSFVRELIYWVAAGLCLGIVWLVAVLFPLWDPKRQTLVDKILNHAALPI